MRYGLITERDGLDRLESLWPRLWAETSPPPPMLEYEWVRQWWRLHNGEGRLFVVVALDDGGTPVGLAPLYRRFELGELPRCLRTILFLGTGERERDEVAGQYLAWLAHPDQVPAVSAAVAEALADLRGAWDRVLFDNLWPTMRLHEELPRGLGDAVLAMTVSNRPAFRSPVFPLDLYIARLRSSKLRNQCRRVVRQARAAGIELVRAHDATAARSMLKALRTLHQRRWAGRGKPGVFASPIFSGFQEHIVARYMASNRAWLVGLRRGERWLAVRYLLRAGDRLYSYLSGVDTEGEPDLAPGMLLHLLTIDHGVAEGVQVYDFMGGDYEYKRRLALETDTMPGLDLFGRTSRARLWLAARRLRGWIWKEGHG